MTIVIVFKGFLMKKISKSKLKPIMLKIFRNIEKTGEEVIVTDHGRPVLKIIPYRALSWDFHCPVGILF